jgi:hypothetical protein
MSHQAAEREARELEKRVIARVSNYQLEEIKRHLPDVIIFDDVMDAPKPTLDVRAAYTDILRGVFAEYYAACAGQAAERRRRLLLLCSHAHP